MAYLDIVSHREYAKVRATNSVFSWLQYHPLVQHSDSVLWLVVSKLIQCTVAVYGVVQIFIHEVILLPVSKERCRASVTFKI